MVDIPVDNAGIRYDAWLKGMCPSCLCWAGTNAPLTGDDPNRLIAEGVIICSCCATRNTQERNQEVLRQLAIGAQNANRRPEARS